MLSSNALDIKRDRPMISFPCVTPIKVTLPNKNNVNLYLGGFDFTPGLFDTLNGRLAL